MYIDLCVIGGNRDGGTAQIDVSIENTDRSLPVSYYRTGMRHEAAAGHSSIVEQHSCELSIIDTGRIRFLSCHPQFIKRILSFHYVDGNGRSGS